MIKVTYIYKIFTRSQPDSKDKQLTKVLKTTGAKMFFLFPRISIKSNIVLIDQTKSIKSFEKLDALRNAIYPSASLESPYLDCVNESGNKIHELLNIFISKVIYLAFFNLLILFKQKLFHYVRQVDLLNFYKS